MTIEFPPSLPTTIIIFIMPSSKRRRAAPAAENDATPIVSDASTSQLVMLDRYHLLPPEIQRHIIDVACLAPSSAGNDAVHFNQDLPTVLNICIVSRAFKAYAIPSLYRHISITRPSSLHALQQVLQKNPGRAALIRSLHVGPAGGPLPAHWWPLTHAYRPGGGLHVDQARLTDHSCEWITTSLRKDQLPSGYEALESWPIGLRKPSGCREAAIHEALVTACASLDVDLERPGLGHYWSYDAGKAWIPRVFEVQAALDLYLLKLRSLENEDPALVRLAQPGARIPAPCRTGSCSHYPALVITGLPPPRHGWRSFPLGAFMVHRGEILRHLARSGAITDRFDHPITLARSGFDVSVFRPSWERVEPDVRYELRSESWDLEGVHEQYDFADLATLRESDRLVAGWTSPDRPFAGPLSTATLGSTLQLARSVLAFLTNLNNLSLTGYLEAALARSALASSSLRRLTLGPCPPSWLAATANVQELSGLVELRICGAMLDPSAIELITTEMGHLRLFEWSIAELYDSRSEERREGQPR